MFFADIQFSSHSDRPLGQASAVHPRTDVLEIEELVKRADQRVAECEVLLLQLLMRSFKELVSADDGSPFPAILVNRG